MKRFSIALATGVLLAAACPELFSTAQAQATVSSILPKPPPPLHSLLGKSVVPVVHPPAIPRRRRLHGHPSPVVATQKPPVVTAAKPPVPPKPPAKMAHDVAKDAAPAGVVAGAAGAAVAVPPIAEPPKIDPAKGTVTGLPLPRWVAFRSDEVNLRSGPGTQYPIDWQYHRRNLPVQITREFEAWRLVTDPDGTKGWVHQATLTGRRGFMVKDAERTLRQSADDGAKPVALLKPGVVGYIRSCAAQAAWCEVQAGEYRGWIKRADFYGVQPDEAIN